MVVSDEHVCCRTPLPAHDAVASLLVPPRATAGRFASTAYFVQAFREVADLVRHQVEGARRVFVFDHALRSGGATKRRMLEGTQHYGSLVHCDCTVRSGWTRGRDQALGSNEVLDKYGRWPATCVQDTGRQTNRKICAAGAQTRHMLVGGRCGRRAAG